MPSRRKISFKSRPHSSSPKLTFAENIFFNKKLIGFIFISLNHNGLMKWNAIPLNRRDSWLTTMAEIEMTRLRNGGDLEPRGETKGQRKRKRAKKKRKIIFRSRHQMRTLLTRHLWLATMDIWRCLLSLANEKRGPRDKWCRLTIACRITQFMIHNASLGRIHISTRAHTHWSKQWSLVLSKWEKS